MLEKQYTCIYKKKIEKFEIVSTDFPRLKKYTIITFTNLRRKTFFFNSVLYDKLLDLILGFLRDINQSTI